MLLPTYRNFMGCLDFEKRPVHPASSADKSCYVDHVPLVDLSTTSHPGDGILSAADSIAYANSTRPKSALVALEQHDPLRYSFGPVEAARFKCIHHAFLSHAATHPDETAVEHLGTTLSYRALKRQSERMSYKLRSAGVGRGTRVCLLVSRSIAMVIGIIGVLRAGASYIPLDGRIVTDSTFAAILEDARPAVVLCSKQHMNRTEQHNLKAVCLEDTIDDEAAFALTARTTLPDSVQPNDEAYVIYTSGTTGQPKGVSVSHSNVTNSLTHSDTPAVVCLSPGDLGIRPGVRVAQILNVAFDMCAWEILGCLSNGGTLCLRGTSRAEWTAVLQSVDVIISTPSILLRYAPEDFRNIHVVVTAGEPCPQALADRWARNASFFNCCGPTEVTIVNTMHLHTAGIPITIGRPTPNNAVYILDENLQLVPEGVAGVIWAGGAGVSKGYVNRAALTRERFRLDPFSSGGGFMYNTGDLGRWRANGKLDHLGRVDDQVKVKGFRVELDGVATAMRTCPGVASAAAILAGSELWGVFSPASVPPGLVARAATQIQPYYAVPTRYLALDTLPVTSNGKTDKQELRRMIERSQ